MPETVARLRATLYPALVGVANAWNEAMGIDVRYPDDHARFLARCHAAGQGRPTPLLLQYGPGALKSSPGHDSSTATWIGKTCSPYRGEFVLTEQRPRMQSRPEVVPLVQGDAVVFAVHHRPVRGSRGGYRVNMRHGVSRLRSGHRHTLGVIFHDAQ